MCLRVESRCNVVPRGGGWVAVERCLALVGDGRGSGQAAPHHACNLTARHLPCVRHSSSGHLEWATCVAWQGCSSLPAAASASTAEVQSRLGVPLVVVSVASVCAWQVGLSVDGGCQIGGRRPGCDGGRQRCIGRDAWRARRGAGLLRLRVGTSSQPISSFSRCAAPRQLRAPMAEGAAAAAVVVGDAQVRASCSSTHTGRPAPLLCTS